MAPSLLDPNPSTVPCLCKRNHALIRNGRSRAGSCPRRISPSLHRNPISTIYSISHDKRRREFKRKVSLVILAQRFARDGRIAGLIFRKRDAPLRPAKFSKDYAEVAPASFSRMFFISTKLGDYRDSTPPPPEAQFRERSADRDV